MLRFTLVLVVSIMASSAASAASWADGMFDQLSKDFGSVPHGPTLTYPFRLTNNTSNEVHIASVRVSCGCTTATAMESQLAPGQATVILAQMDTRRFSGAKAVTIFVQFDRPHWEEVRLWVQANSRTDLVISPEAFAFGQVRRGQSPAVSINVSFLGHSDWQIQEVRCESNYVKTTLTELRRQDSEVAYQVTAKVRPDTPVGKWYTDVWLQTNNASTPRVRVPLTIDIESALSVSPPGVAWEKVKVGTEAERKIIIRGAKPFRITSLKGTDDILSVRDSASDSQPVHVLTLTVKPRLAGDMDRVIQVITDLEDEGEIEFHARAQVVP